MRRLEFTCELGPTPTGRIQSNIDTKVGARSTPSGRASAGREERGERKGLRVVMMRALVEEFDGARDAEVC